MERAGRKGRGLMRPGQVLVAAGFAGLEGSRLIVLSGAEELAGRFSQSFLDSMRQTRVPRLNGDSCDWRSLGAAEWEETGEGGIDTALWNLSGACRLGFTIDLLRIPVKQGTIEICERYALNPYRLYSADCMVFAADRGDRLAEELAERGIPAAVIGRVNPGTAREVVYGQNRGFMERPREDELRRLGVGFPGDGRRVLNEREDSGVSGKEQPY